MVGNKRASNSTHFHCCSLGIWKSRHWREVFANLPMQYFIHVKIPQFIYTLWNCPWFGCKWGCWGHKCCFFHRLIVKGCASMEWYSISEENGHKVWWLAIGARATPHRCQSKKIWDFIHSYHNSFAFRLEGLEGHRSQPIQLEDNHKKIWWHYRLSVSERASVQSCCQELLATGLIEHFNGECVCAKIMPSKKDMFEDWTEERMYEDYRYVSRMYQDYLKD